MLKKIYKFFDKLEDSVRGKLSRYPIPYTIIGGIAIVLFWRAVWLMGDHLALLLPPQYLWLDGPLSFILSVSVLLITGLFVSFFITDRIILSGLNQEKKLAEKTGAEIRRESDAIAEIKDKVEHMEQEIKEIHDTLIKH